MKEVITVTITQTAVEELAKLGLDAENEIARALPFADISIIKSVVETNEGS